MKILKASGRSGSALFATIIATAVIGAALTAYLTMVKNQNTATMRSQAWNNSMPVIEAGIEDALSHMGEHGETNLACDYWTQSGGLYYMKRWVGGHYYVVTISNWFAGSTNQPVLESRGYVTMPVVASASGPVMANVIQSVALQNKTYLGRGVRARAKQDFLFSKGLIAQNRIDLNGNNIETDSFDSSDPNGSSNGMYNVSIRRYNGDIASNSQNPSGIMVDVGNAKIRGRVSTGPGGTVGINVNGAVGDETWFAGNNTGIQDGAVRDDMNLDFKEISEPYPAGSETEPMGGMIGTNLYKYILGNDDYWIDDFKLINNEKAIVTGVARLYVTDTLSVGGSASITIAPGGSLKLYIGDINRSGATIGGGGIINNAGYATNCLIYGLPTCTKITINGNGTFIGGIYAPQADLIMNGSGFGRDDFMGAAVVNSATLNGNFHFHYDEALKIWGPIKGYVVTSWEEMSPANMVAALVDCTDVGVIR